jgi:hypothetical protein
MPGAPEKHRRGHVARPRANALTHAWLPWTVHFTAKCGRATFALAGMEICRAVLGRRWAPHEPDATGCVSENTEIAPGVVSKMDEAEEGQKIRQAIAICVSWDWVIGFGKTTKSLGLNVGPSHSKSACLGTSGH